MKRTILVCSLAVSLLFCLERVASARRATPTPGSARAEFYLIDSDDDSPLKPSYNFVDTTYGTWYRVTGFSDNDDGFVNLPITIDSILFTYYNYPIWVLQPPVTITPQPPAMPFTLPGSGISTNGTLCLAGRDSSAMNVPLPSATMPKNLVAPLWADWEFRTTGDSTKVYVRVANDSFYVTYYNLSLKGTNGQVRATFQIAFSAADSSMLFTYRSFDGSYQGVSAASLIQRLVTIGMTDGVDGLGVTYLHKGYYFATNPNPAYEQSLHNHLAIRFLRMPQEAFLITTVTMPPNDRYELSTTQMTPQCKIANVCDTDVKVFVQTTITNSSGATVYNRSDSTVTTSHSTTTYNAPLASNLTCGKYRITFQISYRNGVSDAWADNNSFSRTFVSLSSQSSTFRDEFDNGISPCTWSNGGAETRAANTVMRNPDAPNTVHHSPSAVVMNRLDLNGNSYPVEVGGDTLISGPIDLSTSTNVHLSFHYQRGLSSDTSLAGILTRFQSGPEATVTGPSNALVQAGDSLLIEGLKRSGSKWNPSESDWSVLGVITGGLDANTQTFRMLLDTSFQHDHFRVRFRLKARNGAAWQHFFEDGDNFVIDAVHVEPLHTQKTEFEAIDVDLGNGPYTHVPRNLATWMIPKIRILNNGDGVDLGVSLLHVTIVDALSRIVYDQTRPFTFPTALRDSLFPMAPWNLQGSQGPNFTVYVTIGANYFEAYPTNDTNIFAKTLYIDDSYALDDGTPDTVGSSVSPATDFYFTFHSAMKTGNDTLRGADFFYRAASATSNWAITIVGNADSAVRTVSLSPTGRGWFRGTFTPYVMRADSTYRIHLVMSSGSNLGGDASNGLVYYTYIDSTTPSNDQFAFFRPDVLGLFANSSRTSYLSPTTSIANQGGYLLPMFRLVTSGALNFLPIELQSLSALRAKDGSVTVQWEMAAEDGIATYEIDRADDVVGSMSARGESRSAYALQDADAPGGATTYRLTGRLLDGSTKWLGEVRVGPLANANTEFQVYPNPATDEIAVRSSEPMTGLEIIDPMGRVLRVAATSGPGATLDVRSLPAGSYWIRAHIGEKTVLAKVLLAR